METKIVASISASGTGCTFMDWSILYLSGKDRYYSFLYHEYIPLVQNPVKTMNAHGHKKNHFRGVEKNRDAIDKFLSKHSGLLTLYPLNMDYETAAKECNVDLSTVHIVENNNKIFNQQFQDFRDLWLYLQSVDSKIVYIEDDPNLILVRSEPRSTERGLTSSVATTVEEINQERQMLFFPTSMATWKELNLTDIWDERERQALDIRPFSSPIDTRESMLPFEFPHIRITTSEFWNQGESVIKRVMSFCDLEIDQSRWDQWVNIYDTWKKVLEPRVSFCYRLPVILKCIVNNWYYDIGELTFIQEVIIQHCLIYKHNLNLKTWQLDKFPQNTQDLYKLLEPNIHQTQDIYRVRSTA